MSLASTNDVRQYAKQVINLRFSFRTKAGQNPDAIRDGKSKIIKSVTRSGGVYTVTFNPAFPLPRQTSDCQVSMRSAAAPTKFCQAYEVAGSLDTTARTMQFVVINFTTGAQGAAEPDDATWVTVNWCGPGIDTFKDAV